MENTIYSNMEKNIEETRKEIDRKQCETLIIASIETLKWQKIKCEIDEVRKLVIDSLKKHFSKKF